jgi:hypothetical protein
MITISQRKLLIWATLSLFFVFAFGGRTFAITKAKLFAPDGVADDKFGLSVAIDGNVLVVGAPYRDDANGSNVGSAYVFEWNSTALQWDPVDQLFADNGAAGDNFGSSVAISGDFIMVGAPNKKALINDSEVPVGAVYVFQRNSTTSQWDQVQNILGHTPPPYASLGESFGFSLSMDADVAVVGAVFATGPEVGDPPQPPQLTKRYTGAAYVFRYNVYTDTWVEEQMFLPPDAAKYDFVGFSVSAFGDRALVGAPNFDNNNVTASGAAFVYHYNLLAETWEEEATLFAYDGTSDAQLGLSVSIYDNLAVVGAPLDEFNVTNTGSAYVFQYNSLTETWGVEDPNEPQKLLASDREYGDFFGGAVSIDWDKILVGASNDDGNGSGYLYQWNGSEWVEQQKFFADDGSAGDYFGRPLALSGDVAVFGALNDDDHGTNSGAVYVFMPSPEDQIVDGKNIVESLAKQIFLEKPTGVEKPKTAENKFLTASDLMKEAQDSFKPDDPNRLADSETYFQKSDQTIVELVEAITKGGITNRDILEKIKDILFKKLVKSAESVTEITIKDAKEICGDSPMIDEAEKELDDEKIEKEVILMEYKDSEKPEQEKMVETLEKTRKPLYEKIKESHLLAKEACQ